MKFHPIFCTKYHFTADFVQFRSISCTKHHFIADFVQFRLIYCTKYTALGHQVQLHPVTGYICHRGPLPFPRSIGQQMQLPDTHTILDNFQPRQYPPLWQGKRQLQKTKCILCFIKNICQNISGLPEDYPQLLRSFPLCFQWMYP